MKSQELQLVCEYKVALRFRSLPHPQLTCDSPETRFVSNNYCKLTVGLLHVEEM